MSSLIESIYQTVEKENIMKEEFNQEQFESQLETAFKEQFPNGVFSIKLDKGFGSAHFVIRFTMLSKEDWPNKIWQNDPINTIIFVETPSDDMFEAVLVSGGRLSVNPPAGSFMAMDLIKIPFRKTKGSPEKIVKYLADYFKKIKQTVIDNQDNIYGRKNIPDSYFK